MSAHMSSTPPATPEAIRLRRREVKWVWQALFDDFCFGNLFYSGGQAFWAPVWVLVNTIIGEILSMHIT